MCDIRGMEIEITSRPVGEAPEWVRDKWVGLHLPTQALGSLGIAGFGVLSGPKSLLGDFTRQLLGRAEVHNGYLVHAATAIELLKAQSPEAAAWWRENTPHMLKWGRRFVFDPDCCRVVAVPASRLT